MGQFGTCRPPRRTPAFLAANRSNAQKSTGPRTALGKQRSAANAFRNGNRASPAFWTRGLSHRELAEFYALRAALDRALCAGSEGQKLVGLATAMVWSVRRYAERHLRTLPPEKRRQNSLPGQEGLGVVEARLMTPRLRTRTRARLRGTCRKDTHGPGDKGKLAGYVPARSVVRVNESRMCERRPTAFRAGSWWRPDSQRVACACRRVERQVLPTLERAPR